MATQFQHYRKQTSQIESKRGSRLATATLLAAFVSVIALGFGMMGCGTEEPVDGEPGMRGGGPGDGTGRGEGARDGEGFGSGRGLGEGPGEGTGRGQGAGGGQGRGMGGGQGRNPGANR